MPFRSGGFALTPPSMALFAVSVVIAVVAVLVYGRFISIPTIGGLTSFHLLGIAYVVLALGVVVRRL